MADCSPDYPVLGMQAGEEIATMLRLVALMISISVAFPWLSSKRRGRMRIFFLHWTSGVMYVMSQFIISVTVLNCWTSSAAGPFIFFLKAWELTVLNLWSISSLAMAILIASIAQSFAKLRRVPAMIGTTRAALCCVLAAVVATALSASFWNDLLITGAYIWVTNTDTLSHKRWISLSFGATQTVAGMLMALAVLFTVTGERLTSLIACCKASQHVKYHFILTVFGTCVYLYNGIVLMVDEFSDFNLSKRFVIIGWCSRYVHVVADTIIIIGAFYALDKKEEEEGTANRRSSSCNGTNSSQVPPSLAAATRPVTSLTVNKADIGNDNNLEEGFGRGPPGREGEGGGPVSATTTTQKSKDSTRSEAADLAGKGKRSRSRSRRSGSESQKTKPTVPTVYCAE